MSELFSNFEVNRDSRWDLILKLLGGSLVFHLLALASVAYIPGVRDALNIAVLFSDTSFVDRPYDRTEIGNDVQMVELPGGKFRYPDGYFAMDAQGGPGAQPTLTAAELIAQANPQYPGPVFRPQPPQPELSPEPTVTPTPFASPTPSSSPAPVATGSPSQAIAQSQASPSPSKNDKTTPDQAQSELEASAKKNNIDLPKEGEINKQPLKDIAAEAMRLKNEGKLDLDQPFEIVIEAELDEQGKLKNPKFTKTVGDPTLVELSGRMIAALNDSGFLIYLKRINEDNPGTKVIFTVKQDQSEIMATVESDTSSVSSAGRLSKAFNILLAAGAKSREGKDEEVLLKNTTASQDGKRIKFNLTMPRQPVVDLLKKQLAS